MHVHFSAMGRLNSMQSRLPFWTLTKLCLLATLLSGTLVHTKSRELKQKPSKISSSAMSRTTVIFNAITMREYVCGAIWVTNIFKVNPPQIRLLPLSNNDINNLLWDIITVFGDKYSGDYHSEGNNRFFAEQLDIHNFWSKLTEYSPGHELYDQIWNSFTWRDPVKVFANSKDALEFISQLHLALQQSSRKDTDLNMLMDFFDQPLYFDHNNPRFKSFPRYKNGDLFLSNFKIPGQILSLIPRNVSPVKAIEEVQNMISFDRKEMKYKSRIINVRTIDLRKINKRCKFLKPTSASSEFRVCGELSLPTARITGGKEATQGSWPWMAYLEIRAKGSSTYNMCGGVLISEKHLLTAAHCVVGNPADNVQVYLGEFDLDEIESPYEAENIFSHEYYNRKGNNEHDIALIKLKGKVMFNNDRRPICLPPSNVTLDGKYAYIAGWGVTDNGYTSKKLLEAFMPMWEDAKCRRVFRRLSSQQLCVGGEGAIGTCYGDSGGSVMYQTASRQWMVVGLVSMGINECGSGNPTVTTRVSTYLDWIEDKLKL